MAPRRFRLLLVLLLVTGTARGGGDVHLQVAVASSFRPALEELRTQVFAPAGAAFGVSSAATGVLYQQILHGAPFDLFLAADALRPARLEAAGRIAPGSRRTYAIGQVVLAARGAGGPVRPEQLERPGVRFAMADAALAPYGRAARQVLQQRGQWSRLQGRVISAMNAAQAFQLLLTGNVDYAFVALVQVRAATAPPPLRWWAPPPGLHDPLAQQAVILRGARDRRAADRFLALLTGTAARARIAALGFGLPAAGAATRDAHVP